MDRGGVVRCGAVRCGAVRCGAVRRGVAWCGVAGCCGVVWCGVVWCGVVWCGVVWCGVVWCGVVWCGVVWCGVVWCGVVWCGVVWCGVVCRRRFYQKAMAGMCCVRAVCMCVGPGGERGSRGDLVGTPLATVLTPGALAALPLAPLVGAGVAPAMTWLPWCDGAGWGGVGRCGAVRCGVVWCFVVVCGRNLACGEGCFSVMWHAADCTAGLKFVLLSLCLCAGEVIRPPSLSAKALDDHILVRATVPFAAQPAPFLPQAVAGALQARRPSLTGLLPTVQTANSFISDTAWYIQAQAPANAQGAMTVAVGDADPFVVPAGAVGTSFADFGSESYKIDVFGPSSSARRTLTRATVNGSYAVLTFYETTAPSVEVLPPPLCLVPTPPPPPPTHPPNSKLSGMTECDASLASACKGHRGAEATLGSRVTAVPLSCSQNKISPGCWG